MKASKRNLIGRRIVEVNFHPFRKCINGLPAREDWSTDPVLTLDNGRKIYFAVAETETGHYGIEIRLLPKAVEAK